MQRVATDPVPGWYGTYEWSDEIKRAGARNQDTGADEAERWARHAPAKRDGRGHRRPRGG
jgi:hypothetical protein